MKGSRCAKEKRAKLTSTAFVVGCAVGFGSTRRMHFQSARRGGEVSKALLPSKFAAGEAKSRHAISACIDAAQLPCTARSLEWVM